MAKKSSCPSCGSHFVRGRYVVRITTDGAVRQRVCKACASLATLVLASDAPSRCAHCGVRLARFCHGCIAAVLDAQLGTRAARALGKAAPEEWSV